MTVVRHGQNVETHWFDSENRLRADQFPAPELILIDQNSYPDQIDIDDRVRLRSGGPAMRVVSIDSGIAECHFNNSETARFPGVTLENLSALDPIETKET
jgi:uncharacterized protein YodC (DUF2158 family)